MNAFAPTEYLCLRLPPRVRTPPTLSSVSAGIGDISPPKEADGNTFHSRPKSDTLFRIYFLLRDGR